MWDHGCVRAVLVATFSFVAFATGGSAQTPTPQQQSDEAMKRLQKSSDDINNFIQQNGANSAQGGTAPQAGARNRAAQTTDFKVGATVDAVSYDGKWYPGRVVEREGCDGTCGDYKVLALEGTDTWIVHPGPNIRAHTMTPAEQAESHRDAAELAARARSGNGIGAQYGVREPTTCRSRAAPPGTASTAKKYVMCDAEGFDGVENVNILSDVNVQVAPPRAFIYTRDSGDRQIDVKAPVYDIRGSYKKYQCGKPHTAGGAYVATHNCILYDEPQAAGSCFRDTFADWHCSLTGSRLASTGVAGQMAPR